MRPKLILATQHSTTVDFGSVGTGDMGVRTVTVLNISTDSLKLCSSLLDPTGPFQLRNALRSLQPQKTHDLLLYFMPTVGGEVIFLLCATFDLRMPQVINIVTQTTGFPVCRCLTL